MSIYEKNGPYVPPQKGVSIWVRNTEGTSKVDVSAAKFTLLRVL